MIKHLFFSSILLCVLLGCHGASVVYAPPAIKDLSVGQVEYEDSTVSSFEQPNSCEGFELTDVDLSELFQKAHYVPMEEVEEQEYSRCRIKGSGILEENGGKVFFYIDRARNVALIYQDETDDPIKRGESYHCVECTTDKFYPLGWKSTSNRPVIKNITFWKNGARLENGIVPEDGCKGFLLTENDVREFFNVARPADKIGYSKILEASACFASGTAILQDGRNTTWFIDRFRRGEMLIQGGSPLYYYGAEVNSPLYSEVCDIDCIRGETED